MSKMIQLRNVPDRLHVKLKVRAAEQGLSLSDFILAELERLVDRLTPQELAERSLSSVRKDFEPSPAELIRRDRDRRRS
jgi:plasmid stability protein